jgi:hypothetical protein
VLADAVSSGSSDQQSQKQKQLQLQRQQQHGEQEQEHSPLQLTSFCSSLPSSGRMLLGLAGLAQLTSLQLTLGDRPPTDGCAAALATLTAMRTLTLPLETVQDTGAGTDWGQAWSSGQPHRLSTTLQHALKHLTKLTHLCLGWAPDNLVFSQFPISLASLQFGEEYKFSGAWWFRAKPTLELHHLTRLTNLQVTELEGRATVPQSLRSLTVDHLYYLCDPDDGPKQLQQLQHLQHLHLQQSCRCREVTMLQQLTQLTHLGMVCSLLSGITDERDAKLSAVMPTVPLKWLRLYGVSYQSESPDISRQTGVGSILAALGSCTQLTHLQLESVRVGSSVVVLCEQLQKLPALEELQLVSLEAPKLVGPGGGGGGGGSSGGGGGSDADADAGVVAGDGGQVGSGSYWGPLWREFALLAPLRSLMVQQVPLQDGDVSALGAASQLACLRLVDCGVGEAAAAQLKSAFEHLPGNILLMS